MKFSLVCLTFILLLVGCDKTEPEKQPPRPALVMTVNSGADANSMILVGEVRPRYESSQGFRIDGKIIERKVDVGTTVKKNQLLARLDPADSRLSAEAAQAEVHAADASRTLATAELARYQQLFAKNFVSASALEIKQAGLKNAKAKLAEAKARANVSANQTKYTDLVADRDGIVTMIRAEPGQVVETGNVIVQIADTNNIEIEVAVPESRISEVQQNAKVGIKLWADAEKTYQGIVREIAPAADSSTRAFNVRIKLSEIDAALKLGMTAKVKFYSPNALQNSGFLVPSGALTEIGGQKTLWVIDANNKVQPRTVTAGEFIEQGVWVSSGLKNGEKIAIAGVHTLVKDQEVRPVIESQP